MRITFYYESLCLGGQQTYTLNTIRALRNAGHDVTLLCSSGGDLLPSFERECKVIQLGLPLGHRGYRRRPWLLPLLVHRIRDAARASGAEALLGGSALGTYLCGLAAVGLKLKVLWFIGGTIAQVNPSLPFWFRRIRFDRLVDGYLGWPEVFRELAILGVGGAKCFEFPNAVNTDFFRPGNAHAAAETRARLGIPTEALVVGWVGRMGRKMQMGATVELVALLARRGRCDVWLLAIGGGTELERTREQARLAGVGDRSIFTDWVPYERVPELIGAMDVVPLLEADPQGGSILRETMACGGVAITVAGASGSQERFISSETGVLLSPHRFLNEAADFLTPRLSGCEDFQRIGCAARKYALESMSFGAVAVSIEDALARLHAGALIEA